MPLVLADGAFDERLLRGSGAACVAVCQPVTAHWPNRLHVCVCACRYIPPPEQLTPEVLAEVLAGLSDPAMHADCLEVGVWQRTWESAIGS